MINIDDTLDPFQTRSEGKDNLVHVRIQQRNGRKTLTTVQGISQEYDLKKIVKVCKKVKRTFLRLKIVISCLWNDVTIH